VLATSHFDRHTSYVALSRHRDNATVFYATDDFGGRRPGTTPESVHEPFTETLSRARPKELAHDYLEREAPADVARVSDLSATAQPGPTPLNDIDARQQAAAERWAARQQNGPPVGQGSERAKTHMPTQTPTYEKDRQPELRRDAPEDDLEI
jgi:hypothetical protein